MDIRSLLSDYSIPVAGPNDRHHRDGWANIACPFHETDNPGFHLGIPDDGFVFTCFSCGNHSIVDTVSRLFRINSLEARILLKEYGGQSILRTKERTSKIRLKAHKRPSNTVPLLPGHRNYLLNRKFDPDKLITEWDIEGTGMISLLDHIDYSRRIFIPIYWEGQEATFQTRDITGRHPMKYLACPEERELIKHKHIVYKHPDFNSDVCICCEGVTDVWRFGRNAIATFGIKYTRQQVRLIGQMFRRVAVCFDDEPQAVRQANKLVAELKFQKVAAFRIDIVGDPGGMDQKEADYLVKQIIH